MNENNRRVETSFRIAANTKMWLINRAHKLGCTVGKLLEVIVTDYIQQHSEEETASSATSGASGIEREVGDISSELLFRIYEIYFMRMQGKFEFPKQTGITPDSVTFQYLSSANLQDIFENYLNKKSLAVPDFSLLFENAKIGYEEPEPFGRVKRLKLSDDEILSLGKQ